MATIPLAALSVQPPQVPSPIAQYARLMQLKSLAGQQQLQQQQIQAATTENQMQALNLQQEQAIQRATQDSGGDLNKFMELAREYGGGMKAITNALAIKNSMLGIDKATLEVNKGKNDELTGMLQPIVDEADPAKKAQMWQAAVGQAVEKGLVDPQAATNYANYPGDDQARLFLNQHKLVSQLADETLKGFQEKGEQAKNYQQQLANISQTLAPAGNQQQLDAAFGFLESRGVDKSLLAMFPKEYSPQNMQLIQKLGLTPSQQATMPVEKVEMMDWLRKHPGKTPADYEAYIKTLPINYRYNLPLSGAGGPGAGGPGGGPQIIPGPGASNIAAYQRLSPAQQKMIDQGAERFAETGQLPAGQRGVNAYTMLIQNRAAELYPGNIAENTAAFKANQKSLETVTSTLDNLKAFEAAAGKNLDMFLDQAKGIIDTGSPWLNTPIRSLSEKGFGSADLAAINTARTVALREIARVTNDPKLSGQLSDSAREEVEGLSPQNATFAQIVRVTGILRQDMKNVESGLTQQRQNILSRLQQPGGSAEQQPQAAQEVKTLTMAQVTQAAKDHGISVEAAKKQALDAGYKINQ